MLALPIMQNNVVLSHDNAAIGGLRASFGRRRSQSARGLSNFRVPERSSSDGTLQLSLNKFVAMMESTTSLQPLDLVPAGRKRAGSTQTTMCLEEDDLLESSGGTCGYDSIPVAPGRRESLASSVTSSQLHLQLAKQQQRQPASRPRRQSSASDVFGATNHTVLPWENDTQRSEDGEDSETEATFASQAEDSLSYGRGYGDACHPVSAGASSQPVAKVDTLPRSVCRKPSEHSSVASPMRRTGRAEKAQTTLRKPLRVASVSTREESPPPPAPVAEPCRRRRFLMLRQHNTKSKTKKLQQQFRHPQNGTATTGSIGSGSWSSNSGTGFGRSIATPTSTIPVKHCSHARFHPTDYDKNNDQEEDGNTMGNTTLDEEDDQHVSPSPVVFSGGKLDEDRRESLRLQHLFRRSSRFGNGNGSFSLRRDSASYGGSMMSSISSAFSSIRSAFHFTISDSDRDLAALQGHDLPALPNDHDYERQQQGALNDDDASMDMESFAGDESFAVLPPERPSLCCSAEEGGQAPKQPWRRQSWASQKSGLSVSQQNSSNASGSGNGGRQRLNCNLSNKSLTSHSSSKSSLSSSIRRFVRASGTNSSSDSHQDHPFHNSLVSTSVMNLPIEEVDHEIDVSNHLQVNNSGDPQIKLHPLDASSDGNMGSRSCQLKKPRRRSSIFRSMTNEELADVDEFGEDLASGGSEDSKDVAPFSSQADSRRTSDPTSSLRSRLFSSKKGESAASFRRKSAPATPRSPVVKGLKQPKSEELPFPVRRESMQSTESSKRLLNRRGSSRSRQSPPTVPPTATTLEKKSLLKRTLQFPKQRLGAILRNSLDD